MLAQEISGPWVYVIWNGLSSCLGQVIYPGKLTYADSFRIGLIGHLFVPDFIHLLTCIEETCYEMKLQLPLEQ